MAREGLARFADDRDRLNTQHSRTSSPFKNLFVQCSFLSSGSGRLPSELLTNVVMYKKTVQVAEHIGRFRNALLVVLSSAREELRAMFSEEGRPR